MEDSGGYTEISGKITAVIFQNAENGYAVVSLENDEGGETTVVGCIPCAAKGELLRADGTWIHHPSHGEQFKAESVERSLPFGSQGVHEYLSSGAIKGIGPATATLIVGKFGSDSLNIIENEPEKLAEIRGVGMKKALCISESFKKQAGVRRLMEFLAGFGLRPQYAVRLYRAYGDSALEIVRDNPYITASEHIGAPFPESDNLALSLGFEEDCPERVAAAILFELSYNSQNGHCFIPREKLIDATSELIGVAAEDIGDGLDILIYSGEIISENIASVQGCYLSSLYEAETYVARRIVDMAGRTRDIIPDIENVITSFESREGLRLAPSQRRTLLSASRRSVMVITGGPGTGKTTTVRAILALYESIGMSVTLTAPTGRAAKRMSELSGRQAVTIHRLLEAGFQEGADEPVFRRDESFPLDTDAVILDECSMVDIRLMKALLSAMPPECSLVIVGDADQLPSIGPGNVLRDIISSKAAETVRLSEIFRQLKGSRIVQSAHMINKGEYPDLSENKGDLYFLRRAPGELALKTIAELCAVRLPQNMGIPSTEIQVLAPTRRGDMGTENLNRRLQQALNPGGNGIKEKPFGEKVFRVGDRVMQNRNNYDIIWKRPDTNDTGSGVYNGDIGRITEINQTEELLVVDYDDRLAIYSVDMLSELEHAFATTVHKSQGSEFRAVILSPFASSPSLMTRRLLYTAITRAKELLIIVGGEEYVRDMIDNHKRQIRYSGLGYRIKGLLVSDL